MLISGATACVHAQSKPSAPPTAADGALAGKKTFAARCAGCHGLDGRGGPRAPNIATKPNVIRLSDAALAKIIFNGRTDFGMPSFRALGSVEVQRTVDYLRVLQGRGAARSLAGDPQKGKAIFFGNGGCSSCHAIGAQGSFVGNDLSAYARGVTPGEIRKAIVDPMPSTVRSKTAVATTRGGQQIIGVVRNEDNFSVQMQSADGAFHFLQKSDLHKIEYQPLAPMPRDYGQRLTPKELDDIVGYLQSIKSELPSDMAEEE